MRSSGRRDDRTTTRKAIYLGFLVAANATDLVPLVKRQLRQPRRSREQRQRQQLPKADRRVGRLALSQDSWSLEFELEVTPDRRTPHRRQTPN